MHLTHLIVDDFLPDPDAVRREVLRMPFPPRHQDSVYPGRNAEHRLQFDGLEGLIGSLVHEKLVPKVQTAHAKPRLAMEGDTSKISVHVDNCHWSAMVYLTLDEHCQGGTHFFRHIPTAWEMAPVFPGEAEAKGYPNAREALEHILVNDGNDRSKWNETMMIPMKYNRLALFRGYLWHDAGVSFGTTPENARLILPFFFEKTQ
ncbi:MAG: DUF6445 family protein [Pseudomonadota bacterium]